MADRLRALYCDNLSIMRGKYLPHSKIGNDDTRFCVSTFAVHYDRDLMLDAPGAMTRASGCRYSGVTARRRWWRFLGQGSG